MLVHWSCSDWISLQSCLSLKIGLHSWRPLSHLLCSRDLVPRLRLDCFFGGILIVSAARGREVGREGGREGGGRPMNRRASQALSTSCTESYHSLHARHTYHPGHACIQDSTQAFLPGLPPHSRDCCRQACSFIHIGASPIFWLSFRHRYHQLKS